MTMEMQDTGQPVGGRFPGRETVAAMSESVMLERNEIGISDLTNRMKRIAL